MFQFCVKNILTTVHEDKQLKEDYLFKRMSFLRRYYLVANNQCKFYSSISISYNHSTNVISRYQYRYLTTNLDIFKLLGGSDLDIMVNQRLRPLFWALIHVSGIHFPLPVHDVHLEKKADINSDLSSSTSSTHKFRFIPPE